MSTSTETVVVPQAAEIAQGSIPRTAWLALASGFLGWMFDAMDINIFTMVLFPSMRELLGSSNPAVIAQGGGLIIALKLAGWGLGGIMFGVVADRIGRSRTLVITILIYCAFTGLSGLAQSWWQLAIMQTIAGIGIGGEWATAGALITETWPERYRARAMQVMQMAWAFGFFAAAVVNLFLGPIGWRWVLAAGAVPAIICIFIRWMVPEPERWEKVRAEARMAAARGESDNAWATFTSIFKPAALRGTIVGVVISMAMMVGSFPGLALIPTWINQLMAPGTGNPVMEISYVFMLLNVGAIFGYITMMWLADAVGRRWAYTIFASCGILSTWYLFRAGTTLSDLKMLIPVYGFFTVGGFGAPAAYLPELFPTRTRGTGVGFCYNMSRLLTAPWPFVGGLLVGALGSVPAAVSTVELFLFVGIIAIWFGPETKGVPLRD
jgi:MFS family permease